MVFGLSGTDIVVGLLTLIGVLGAAVVGGFVTLFVERRKSSGRISTSEASEVWAEGRDLRQVVREQNSKLEATVKDLTTEVDMLKATVIELREQLGAHRLSQQENEILKAANAQLLSEVQGLRDDLSRVRRQIDHAGGTP